MLQTEIKEHFSNHFNQYKDEYCNWAHKFSLFNRPYSAKNGEIDFLYNIYLILFNNHDFHLTRKQRAFESLANNENSWTVVCMSKNAANAIQKAIQSNSNLDSKEKTNSAKGLRRGHPLSRDIRAKFMFECRVPLSKTQLASYFFKYDTVALVTNEENKEDGISHWSDLKCVPEGYLTGGSYSVYARKKDEGWIEENFDSIKTMEIVQHIH